MIGTDKSGPATNDSSSEYAAYHFEQLYKYSPREFERWRRKYSFDYRDFLPVDISAKCLDLGCGGGFFLNFLKCAGYRNLTGVDIDARQLDTLKGVVQCEAFHSDILKFLKCSANKYDCISCHHVIEHFSRGGSDELLRLIYHALNPGGCIILSTPNGARPWMGWHLFSDLSHDHLYTSSSLQEVMQLAGFVSPTLRAGGPVPYDVVSAARFALWKLWREPYLKFAFVVENGLGCLHGAKLIVSADLIAQAVKPK